MKTKILLVMLLTVNANIFAGGLMGTSSVELGQANLKGKVATVNVNESSETCLVSGKVTDRNGKPIIGAVIVNRATKKGVVSDLNGAYSISVSKGVKLEVSYAGYQKAVIKVGDKDNQETDVVLTEDKGAVKKQKSSKAKDSIVLVDGKLFDRGLDEIKADNIEKMTVVKNADDLAEYIDKYGDKAKNGVILIELKK